MGISMHEAAHRIPLLQEQLSKKRAVLARDPGYQRRPIHGRSFSQAIRLDRRKRARGSRGF